MKPRRKLTAIVMAAAMMLTMVPTAFAAENNGGNSERRMTEITEAEVLADLAKEPTTMSANALTPDTNGVYHIYNVNDFDSITQSQWLGNSTFIIENNLDLSTSTRTPSEWGGYITYFRGNLQGANENITISGMENNTYLIYGLNGGTIKDLKLSFSGEAAGLAAISLQYSTPIGVTIENVDTEGYVNLTGDDQSNYSPYAFCAPQGGMTMKNCTNNATINGSIYGGIFYGYYPLNRDADDDIVFDGCVNNANVSMRNASMFFGNPSVDNVMASEETSPDFTITIKNCKNNGIIRGNVSAHYFVSSLSKDLAAGGLSEKIENTILNVSSDSITPHVVSNNNLAADKLIVCQNLTGFAISANTNGDITLTAPSNPSETIDHYVVSVSTPYNYYNPTTYEHGGNDRFTVSETIPANDTTVHLKFYGLADAAYPSFLTGSITLNDQAEPVPYKFINGGRYYILDSLAPGNLYDNVYQRCVGAVNGTTQPEAAYVPAKYLTAVAYGESGSIIGMASWEASES